MPTTRPRVALAACLLLLTLGVGAGCTYLPGFLRGGLSASPSPSAEPVAADPEEPEMIEGQVGNGSASPTPSPTASPAQSS